MSSAYSYLVPLNPTIVSMPLSDIQNSVHRRCICLVHGIQVSGHFPTVSMDISTERKVNVHINTRSTLHRPFMCHIVLSSCVMEIAGNSWPLYSYVLFLSFCWICFVAFSVVLLLFLLFFMLLCSDNNQM